MLALQFSGWAQCRLPTDPDPSDETRGVSGYSYAFAGEPDLDRIIRFQPDKKNSVDRPFSPEVGVRIDSGWYRDDKGRDGSKRLTPEHPLIGAKVDLLGGPQFDSRNYVVVNQGFGVIWPFHFCIDNGRRGDARVRIERGVVMDEDNPDGAPLDLPEDKLNNYLLNTVVTGSALALAQTGIVDPIAFRKHRLKQVKQLRRKTDPDDVVAIAALDKRIDELEWTGPVNRRTQQIPTNAQVHYQINDAATRVEVGSDHGVMDGLPSWNLEMWFGGWDVDSLDFFVNGAIIIAGLDDALAC